MGLIHREARLGQLLGLHSPSQTSWPKANMPRTGLSEPIKRASGAVTGPTQIPLLDQHIQFPKVIIPALFLRDSQAACKEGSRAKKMEEGEIKDTSADEHRYVEVPTEQSLSPLFSVFGRPLI